MSFSILKSELNQEISPQKEKSIDIQTIIVIIHIYYNFDVQTSFVMNQIINPAAPGERCSTANTRAPRRLNSTELFSGHARVVIEHEGAEYTLQITRQGKLILTK